MSLIIQAVLHQKPCTSSLITSLPIIKLTSEIYFTYNTALTSQYVSQLALLTTTCGAFNKAVFKVVLPEQIITAFACTNTSQLAYIQPALYTSAQLQSAHKILNLSGSVD